MTVQQSKRRPLSRYLKDFKHSQTHCAHCKKLLDRITLVRRGEIVNKIAISRLDTLMDEAAWLEEQKEWVALCRFCGDLHCKEQSDFFDIIGFKQFLFEQTEMSHGTVREYVVRLRRLGQHLTMQNISRDLLTTGYLDENLEPWLPATSTNNYRIALRKYAQYRVMQAGAAGYLSKGAAPQEVVNAIRTVHAGQRYIASDIAQQMALSQIEPEKTESPFASLSERELQIMLMITKGQKVNEISEQLNLSPKTVNSYRYRMFSKLNIHGDVELTHLAIRHGLCNAESLISQ